jgi:DNA-binding beta-propeller fold protein YncE
MKVIMTPEGNVLVSEATVTLNNGRVSIVDKGGARRTLLDGLPCGPAFPGGAPLGPAAMALDGRTLYLSILEGNALVAGTGGAPAPNPAGVASPILSSILRIRLSVDVDRVLNGFTLSLDDHYTLADFNTVTLTNSDGQTATIDLLADFPDTPLDRREIYGHVTPYGMTLDPAKQFLYAADAGQNRVTKIDVNTGHWQTLVRFPRIATPAGTQTDPVPTGARFYGNRLLVSFLTGGPFTPGAASIQAINPDTREVRQFINLLTTVTDLLVRDAASGLQFFAVEYRHVLVGAPNTGQVLQYTSPEGRVIATGLQGPTGIAQDPATGDLYVAENAGGRITRIRLQ